MGERESELKAMKPLPATLELWRLNIDRAAAQPPAAESPTPHLELQIDCRQLLNSPNASFSARQKLHEEPEPAEEQTTVKPYVANAHAQGALREIDLPSSVSYQAMGSMDSSSEESMGLTRRPPHYIQQAEDPEEKAMKECIKRVVAEPGDRLDRQRECMKEALGKASFVGVFFSSKPLQAALSGGLIQLWLLFASVRLMLMVVDRVAHLRGNGVVAFHHYRLRGPLTGAGEFSGPLWDGAELSLRNAQVSNLWGEGSSPELRVSFPHATPINGWWRESGNGTLLDGKKDSSFELLGSTEGQEWTTILRGNQNLMLPWPLRGKSRADSASGIAGEDRMIWDFRAPHGWVAVKVVQSALVSFGFGLTLVSARFGHYKLAVVALSTLNVILAVSSFVRAANASDSMDAFFRCCNAVCFLIGFWLNIFMEIYFLLGWLLLGVVDVLEASHEWITDGYLTDANINEHVIPSLITLALFWGVLMFRLISKARARSLVSKDKQVYDMVWNKLIGNPESVKNLEQLEKMLQRLPPPSNKHHVQQVVVKSAQISHTESALSLLSAQQHYFGHGKRCEGTLIGRYTTLFEQLDSSGIQSLDQIFHQARFVHHILLSKIKELAFDCGGHFPCQPLEGGDRFIPWQVACQDPDLANQIIWPGLKSVTRAIEKAVRKYRNDVSLLVDICRAVIVFDDIASLCCCVDKLVNDPDVEIVRVKNRFSQRYDSWDTLGYRDVAFNLRLKTDTSLRFQTDMHVVELQLNLRGFAERKNDEGHRRYIEYRNLVAE